MNRFVPVDSAVDINENGVIVGRLRLDADPNNVASRRTTDPRHIAQLAHR